MKKLLAVLALAAVALLSGCTVGTIETGNVGVVKRWGTISPQEQSDGFYFKLFASVSEATFKETSVDLENLTPRAKDNLLLRDLDISVFYVTDPARIAEFVMAKAGQSAEKNGLTYPGYFVIASLARGAAYDQVSKLDSLTMHKERTALEAGIQRSLQADLDGDKDFGGMFKVTRVVVRTVQTDSSIENAIQQNVQRDKELEAKTKEIEIAKKAAQVQIENAKGLAAANEAVNRSLTPMLLQSQYNQALMKCAEKGSGCTILVGNGVTPLVNLK